MKHLSRKHQLLVSLCCISLTVCLWLGNITSSTIQIQIGKATNAQNSTSSQWVQEGVKKYQANQYLDAIEDWNKALDIEKNNSNPRNKAIISENLARAYQQVGQTENAIKHWGYVVPLYSQLGDVSKFGRSLTELAQVYTSYGQPKKAIELLCNSDDTDKCQTGSALQIAQKNNDFEGQVAALGSLGEAYRLFESCEDDKCKAITILKEGDKINEDKVHNKNYQIAILNSRANIYINRASLNYRRAFSLKKQGDDTENKIKEAKQDDERGLKELEKSLELVRQTDSKLAEVQIFLSKLFIYKRTKTSENVKLQELWNDARELSKALPNNSQTAYIYIDLADKLQPTVDENGLPISFSQCSQEALVSVSNKVFEYEAENLLKKAADIADQIKDNRAKSFALGKLGKLYECSNKYDMALYYTKQARDAVERNLAAKDSLFLWEWQAGRILRKQGKIADAIIAYKNSKHSLEKVRQEILSDNRNFQFDFRDEVEPIYRGLIALQLNAEADNKENKSNQYDSQDLLGALETTDSLKIGELQNYFGSDCIINIPEQDLNNEPDNSDNKHKSKFKDKIVSLIGGNKQTAIISSIIFDNKTAIILTLPSGESEISSKVIWIDEDKESLRKKIINYRKEIQDKYSNEKDYMLPAQELYRILIQPFENETSFKNNQIKTILFVQDGIFQSVPMAGLHDGEKFLVEKYAIATVPSLSLIDNKKFDKSRLQVLALGLAEKRVIDGEEFKLLEHVVQEINSIPNKRILKNENFNRKNLEAELNKQIYSVIHMATHGEAGAESKDTFIVTGEREQGKEKLTITELDEIIRSQTKRQNRIDLLAITACDSAVGDDRSSLGLAGIAVQAGAKSTLASLWSIDDAATAGLTEVFYQSLSKSQLTKAQALQEAQNDLKKQKRHPYYWAPFILVGNWQ